METFAGARVTLGLLLDDRSRVSIDRIASNPDALDDEPSFRAAFEGVMDSDPDVLFVASTLAQPHREALWGLCLSAAEAGHLVFVQLEADSGEDAATRFISALDRPPGDHLAGAVWQELVPHGQGRRARYEFLA